MHFTAATRGWIVSSFDKSAVAMKTEISPNHHLSRRYGKGGAGGEVMKEEVPNWYGYIKRFCCFSRYHKCLHIFSDTQKFFLLAPTRCLKTFLSEHSRFNCETFASRIEVFCFFRSLFSRLISTGKESGSGLKGRVDFWDQAVGREWNYLIWEVAIVEQPIQPWFWSFWS